MESTVRLSEARASIYGELQVTSKYRSRTLGGLVPSAQKLHGAAILNYINSFLHVWAWEIWKLQLHPHRPWISKFVSHWREMHCPLLSKTLVSETTIYRGHQAIDRQERALPS